MREVFERIRISAALNGDFIRAPSDMTREQKRNFMSGSYKNLNEED